MKTISKVATFLGVLLSMVEAAGAEGYLAMRATKLPELLLGIDAIGYGVSQKEYRLETGKAYQ